jgi:hypothetical protein
MKYFKISVKILSLISEFFKFDSIVDGVVGNCIALYITFSFFKINLHKKRKNE